MPSIAQCTGGARPGAPRGTRHTPTAPPGPDCPLRSDLVTVGHSWGHPAPTPGPGCRPSPSLMSAALAAFQLIFCPMACLPSGLLPGLGQGEGTAPRATQRPLRVTQRAAHAFTPFRGAKPW